MTVNRAALAFLVALLVLAGIVPAAADELAVESVVLRLMDERELAASDAGLLLQLLVSEGDRVQKGDLLARIDDTDAKIAFESAKLELQVAEAEADNDVSIRFSKKAMQVARAELARSEESNARYPRSISQSQLDVERLTVDKLGLEIEQAEHELQLARLRVDVARSKVEAAELQLRRRQIVAPLGGTVVVVQRRAGEWLAAGEPLIRIVNADSLKAEGFVSAEEASDELLGQRATLMRPRSEEAFDGKVVFVSPEVDPINRQVRVWAEFDNSEGSLRPGEQIEMTIEQAD